MFKSSPSAHAEPSHSSDKPTIAVSSPPKANAAVVVPAAEIFCLLATKFAISVQEEPSYCSTFAVAGPGVSPPTHNAAV